MITESDLRELFDRESGDGPGRGVTVAEVDRRVRRIRRRRAGLAAGAAAVGLAVAAVFVLPSGSAGVAPQEVWSGVIAQPSKRYGARPVFDVVMDKRFSAMGERVAFDLPRLSSGTVWAQVFCPRGTRVLFWENGRYRHGPRCEEVAPDSGGEGTFASFALLHGGLNRVEVAMVPEEAVERLGRSPIDERDAQRVVDAAGKSRADFRIRITAMRVEPCDSGPDCRFADEPVQTVVPRVPGPDQD
ncbi:hypothetical protein [Planobispora takensis]|uniref:Uncharacterized protein n=1 Tax=Planobispora takensis TaxID=1367882 RepID=A0A8J3SWN2_9ACTN|nr:hypothetical protein [Planobispora takensis]GIH99699.1 hypothetical protein Pta02_17080 [Planobispora takensis]